MSWMDDGRRIERTITHLPGIAKPEAAWDDAVQLNEITVDPGMGTFLQIESMRHGTALVTGEFMRDAVSPLETVGRILDRAVG